MATCNRMRPQLSATGSSATGSAATGADVTDSGATDAGATGAGQSGQDVAAGDVSVSIVPDRPPASPPPLLAVILCPAAGIRSLETLLAAASSRPGLATVVIHEGPAAHPDFQRERLARGCALPVIVPSDGQEPRANALYLVSDDMAVLLRGGRLRLIPSARLRRMRAPSVVLNSFLRSVATSYGSRAAVVVLAGRDRQCIAGIDAIARVGGLCIAQDPAQDPAQDQAPDRTQDRARQLAAQFPRRVIEAGLADQVLSPARMMPALAEHARQTLRTLAAAGASAAVAKAAGTHGKDAASGEQQVQRILTLMRARTRSDFRHQNPEIIGRGIRRRMRLVGSVSAADYLNRLHGDAVELEHLRADLLRAISVFFRDPVASRGLDAVVLRPLLDASPPGRPIRVWVVGCATGEEAYGIAMMLVDGLARLGRSAEQVRVFASDIDEAALLQARHGLYSVAALRNVCMDWRGRFFRAVDTDHYRIADDLRERVLFARHDLLTDAPFSRLDLISCRGALDRLDAPLRKRVLEQFHFGLNQDGWLRLGGDESRGIDGALFAAVESGLYRRRRRPAEARPPTWTRAASGVGVGSQAGIEASIDAGVEAEAVHSTPRCPLGWIGDRAQGLEELARQWLVDTFVPPSILINADGEIQYLQAAANAYLSLPSGAPARTLWALAREGLEKPIRLACVRALRTGAVATIDAVAHDVATPSASRARMPVRIEVRPLQEQQGAVGLLLVSFRDLSPSQTAARAPAQTPVRASAQPSAHSAQGASFGADADAAGLIDELREELGAARDDLFQTIAALHRSNDELQTYNEELMSANEELQAANAELLHSRDDLRRLNGEARRANAELKAKVAAVERANDDINNLLSSTNLATIFLDARLCIKLFTPAAVRLFCLRDGDIGRPLAELSQIVPDPDLTTDCRDVLEADAVVETEIRAADGACCYLRRVQAYRTAAGDVDGIVIVYMDITQRATTESRLRQSERHYRTLFDNSPLCLIEQDWSGIQATLASWRRRAADTAAAAAPQGQESLAQEPSRPLGPNLGPDVAQDMARMLRAELQEDELEALAACRRRIRVHAINAAGRRLLEIDGDGRLDDGPETQPMPPSSRPETFGKLLEQFAEGRTSAECEDELITRRGARVPVQCHFLLLPGAEATAPGMQRVLVAVYDIRERRAMQRAIVASEQRLRRALHVVHEGVWDYDVRNGNLWWSSEYANMWGAPPPTAATTYEWLLDRIHPEDRAGLQACIAQAMAGSGDRWQAEYRCKSADGGYAHVLDRGAITRDDQGRVVRMLGCMLDITDLKQAQQELRKREQRLRSVLDAAADAIITVNSNARILSFNPAAEAMFGHETREIMGQGIVDLFGPVSGRLLLEALCEGQPVKAHFGDDGFLEGVRADGETFPVEVSVRQVEESGLYVILARDLSDQRRLEREIIEMSTRQQQEIGREIHDGLGQELTALLMLASGLERKLARPDGKLTAADFAKMTQYLKRALETARSLSKGLAPADIASEGLPAALQDLSDRMEAASGIACSFSSAGDVHVDDSNRAAHLYRIAQEALSNAVRHAEATRLELALEATPDGLLLSLRDNGKGILPGDEHNGRLGLHLMRYRANILGGECRIEPTADGGTLVRCEVPRRGAGLA